MNREPDTRQDAYKTTEFKNAMNKIWEAGDSL